MKFKFCGENDCPEWILSEIVLLNKITAIKLRLILLQLMNRIKGLDYDAQKVEKLCRDSGITGKQIHSVVAVIDFIIKGAIKYNVEESEFDKELQQVGLPLENSQAFIKSLLKERSGLREAIKNSSFKIARLKSLDYKVGYTLASSQLPMGGIHDKRPLELNIQLKLGILKSAEPKQPTTVASFNITTPQLTNLISEMKKAQEYLGKLDS